METKWIQLSEVDFTRTKNIRIDTRDFHVLVSEPSWEKSKKQLIDEGLSEENFIDGKKVMDFLLDLKRRNISKPIWIGNSDIKYIGLEKCADDHWVVLDRYNHPINWKTI